MSLLGHVVLSLLFEGYQSVTRRYSRYRSRAIQLEDGPCESSDDDSHPDITQSNGERIEHSQHRSA